MKNIISIFVCVVIIVIESFAIANEFTTDETIVSVSTTSDETETTELSTETAILQDVAISDSNYYYKGKPVFLDEDCSVLLNQLLDSEIEYVVPVATYVEYIDGIAIMHLD